MGPWRIVDARGRGAHGSIYLAEGVPPDASGLVALKVAHHPRDARFQREAELLSRLHHPAIPRLIDRGQWISSAGQPHPYIAMQWLDGIPLYEWARAFSPTSRQVLRMLAGLARALEATHAMGAVHRDFKGDNTLVQLPDGQPFLVDFGSCSYRGAEKLTWQPLPPGTPAYRSPEAFRFALHIREAPEKLYTASPTDDLFALGVTAYHLVTEQYPPMADMRDAGSHVWNEGGPGPRPARELNPRCAPELNALISRMLSRHPAARGSARELAEALELAARKAGSQADAPLFGEQTSKLDEVLDFVARKARPPADVPLFGQQAATRAHRSGWPWLAAAGLVGPMVLGIASLRSAPDPEESTRLQAAEHAEAQDAGTVGLGDSALTASAESAYEPSGVRPIGLDLPDKPFSGQYRPDARGRCPRKTMVAINGGCWFPTRVDVKECDKASYVHDGVCYEPAFPPPRPNTSAPTDSRDGG